MVQELRQIPCTQLTPVQPLTLLGHLSTDGVALENSKYCRVWPGDPWALVGWTHNPRHDYVQAKASWSPHIDCWLIWLGISRSGSGVPWLSHYRILSFIPLKCGTLVHTLRKSNKASMLGESHSGWFICTHKPRIWSSEHSKSQHSSIRSGLALNRAVLAPNQNKPQNEHFKNSK